MISTSLYIFEEFSWKFVNICQQYLHIWCCITMYRTHFVQIRDTCSSTYAVGLPVCTNLESGAIQMLKSLSEQGLDLSSFCLSYRLSAGPRRLHHINFQKWVKALQTYKMSKRSWNDQKCLWSLHQNMNQFFTK